MRSKTAEVVIAPLGEDTEYKCMIFTSTCLDGDLLIQTFFKITSEEKLGFFRHNIHGQLYVEVQNITLK